MANWQIGDSEMEWKRNTLWALVLTLLLDLCVTVHKLPRYNSQYAGYFFTCIIGSGWDWIHWWSHTHGCSIDDQNLKSLMSWFDALHVKVALVYCSPNEEFLNRCAPIQEFLNRCAPIQEFLNRCAPNQECLDMSFKIQICAEVYYNWPAKLLIFDSGLARPPVQCFPCLSESHTLK